MEETFVTNGTATRKKNRIFCIHLETDKEFVVDEDELYNDKKYTVLRPEMILSSNDRICVNNKVKRQAKQDEEQ